MPEIGPGLFFFEGMAFPIALVSKTILKPFPALSARFIYRLLQDIWVNIAHLFPDPIEAADRLLLFCLDGLIFVHGDYEQKTPSKMLFGESMISAIYIGAKW